MKDTKTHHIIPIRKAGVPLTAWETADPAASIIQACRAAAGLNGSAPKSIMQWDIMKGLTGVNDEGRVEVSDLSPDGAISTGNPAECLAVLARASDWSMIFMHNAHRILEPANLSISQGIWNLRDDFKSRGCTLILLGPSITLPEELKRDVVLITEPLPDAEEIGGVLDFVAKEAALPPIEAEERSAIIDAMLGLAAGEAENALSMSLTKTGVNRSQLWERKCKAIEQTNGLSVCRVPDTFDDVAGVENAKGFLRAVLKGKRKPKAIGFMDEIEKSLAGAGTDSSGVSQDYLGQLLSWMQDRETTGMIFIGPPGCAKSALAKAAGNEAGIPTVQMDLGGMKGSLVGESEMRLRSALKVMDAISQGSALLIATCNSFGILPPELKRRFMGTFMFDLPTLLERDSIWDLYMKKYELPKQGRPADSGWTGAEIKQACQIAWRLDWTLMEAAKFIVPVAKSAAETIEKLRSQASGRFICASAPGLYQHVPAPTGRKLSK